MARKKKAVEEVVAEVQNAEPVEAEETNETEMYKSEDSADDGILGQDKIEAFLRMVITKITEQIKTEKDDDEVDSEKSRERYVNLIEVRIPDLIAQVKDEMEEDAIDQKRFETKIIGFQERLEKILKSTDGDLFYALYGDGDLKRTANDTNLAIFTLLDMLIYWFEGQEQDVAVAFEHSALFTKLDESDKEWWEEYKKEELIRDCFEKRSYYESSMSMCGRYIDAYDIMDKIRQAANDNEHANEITVLPYMCGFGKSQAIRRYLEKVYTDQETGVLILTDMIDRMGDYSRLFDEEEKYVYHPPMYDEDQHIYTVSTADTRREEKTIEQLADENNRPALIMTTQYFNMLEPWQIEEDCMKFPPLYSSIKKFRRRTLLLVDERSGIKQPCTFSVYDIGLIQAKLDPCKIHAKFNEDPNEFRKELEWCYEYFGRIKEELRGIEKKYKPEMDSYVSEELALVYKKSSCFYMIHGLESVTEEGNKRFKKLYKEHYSDFISNDGTKNPVDILTALSDWVVYNYYYNNRHENSNFDYIVDRRRNYFHRGTKVIVLDGTADLTFEYNESYFDKRMIGSDDCKRNLEKLTVHIYDMPSSKNYVHEHSNDKIIKIIEEFMTSQIQNQEYVFFTYKGESREDLETTAKKHFRKKYDVKEGEEKQYVEHFGAIRGKNIWKEYHHIVQYGLNEFTSATYLMMYLSNHPEKVEKLKEMGPEECSKAIAKLCEEDDERFAQLVENDSDEEIEEILKEREALKNIKENELLSDIDQNIFRGAIRNADNTEEMHFYLFLNKNNYSGLVSKIKERYEGMNARVVEEDSSEYLLAKMRERNQDTLTKEILIYIDNLPAETVFTKAAMRKAIGEELDKEITGKDLDDVITHNMLVYQKLNRMKVSLSTEEVEAYKKIHVDEKISNAVAFYCKL